MRPVRDLVLSLALAVGLITTTAQAAPVRPVGAPAGELAAEVDARIGTGSAVVAGGKRYPALPGTALLRTDELVVPAGQVLIVKLRNGRLVRLDDDVTLRVSQIVLLDAPRSTEPVSTQLDRLLSKDEQGRAERIAGVQAHMAGGSSLGSVEAVAPVATPSRTEAPREVTQAAPASKAARATTPPTPAPAPPAREAPRRGPGDDEVSAPDRGPPSPAIGGVPAVAGAPSLASEPRLRACLTTALRKLPVRVKRVSLRLFVERGVITRAGLVGGLELPACARPLLVGATYAGPEGRWLEREIELR